VRITGGPANGRYRFRMVSLTYLLPPQILRLMKFFVFKWLLEDDLPLAVVILIFLKVRQMTHAQLSLPQFDPHCHPSPTTSCCYPPAFRAGSCKPTFVLGGHTDPTSPQAKQHGVFLTPIRVAYAPKRKVTHSFPQYHPPAPPPFLFRSETTPPPSFFSLLSRPLHATV